MHGIIRLLNMVQDGHQLYGEEYVADALGVEVTTARSYVKDLLATGLIREGEMGFYVTGLPNCVLTEKERVLYDTIRDMYDGEMTLDDCIYHDRMFDELVEVTGYTQGHIGNMIRTLVLREAIEVERSGSSPVRITIIKDCAKETVGYTRENHGPINSGPRRPHNVLPYEPMAVGGRSEILESFLGYVEDLEHEVELLRNAMNTMHDLINDVERETLRG